jgi:hypothetical protein
VAGAPGAASRWEDPRMSREALRDCTGYRVVTPDGRVGSVAAVLPSTRTDGAGVLIVHSGPTCGLSAMPFDEVEGVDVQGRRLVVRTTRAR